MDRNRLHNRPPPLPPKPPLEYTMSSTAATSEFCLNRGGSKSSDRAPYAVSEFVDKRPNTHPLGPRQPGNENGFSYQPHNKFIGVYASSNMPASVPGPPQSFTNELGPPLRPVPSSGIPNNYSHYDQSVDLYGPPKLSDHRLPATPVITQNDSLISDILNSYPDEPELSHSSSIGSSVHRSTSTNTAYSTTSYYYDEPTLYKNMNNDNLIDDPNYSNYNNNYSHTPTINIMTNDENNTTNNTNNYNNNTYNVMHHALRLQPDNYPNQDWDIDEEEAKDIPVPSPGFVSDVSFQYYSGDDHSDEPPVTESAELLSKLRKAVTENSRAAQPTHGKISNGNSPVVGNSPSRYSQRPFTPPMQRSPIRRGVSPGWNQNVNFNISPRGLRSPGSTKVARPPPGYSPNQEFSSYDEDDNFSDNGSEDAFYDLNNGKVNHSNRPMARLSMDGELRATSLYSKRRSLPNDSQNSSCAFNDLSELEISLDDSTNKNPSGIPRSISSVLPKTNVGVKRKPVMNLNAPSVASGNENVLDSLNSSTRSFVDNSLMIQLGLPEIPASVSIFDAKKLSSKDYERCQELWSLSQMARWVASLKVNEMEITHKEIIKALVGLFTHFVPTFNHIRAERMAEDALQSMLSSGFVFPIKDDCVDFNFAKLPFGVFPLITGKGCYTDVHNGKDETALSSLRCYSSRCSRTIPLKGNLLPDVNLKELSENNSDWASYWKISDEQIEDIDKREAKKQYAIHELIMGEESYVRDLTTLLSVFGESLKKLSVPPIMTDQELFWQHSFGSVETLIGCNSEHLLRPFKYRQQQQGPFIDGIADVILNWLESAREPYMNYSDSYLYTDRRIRREKETNQGFASWLERASKDPRAKGVPYSFYFHRAIPRLARYGLLLRTIQKSTMDSDPEWQLLEKCIKECDKLTGECNKRLARVEKTMELLDLQEQLQFKSPEVTTNLRIKHPRRKVIRRGDVLRRGEYKLDWIEAHIILLDNFLILSKIRKGYNGTRYYISRRPIPMDLLVLESVDGDGVTKSSKLGVGTFTTHVSQENKRISRQFLSGSISPTKAQTDHNLGTSAVGQASVTALDDDKEVMYPFRITHLGRFGNSYTLYAPSSLDRDRWRDAIIKAKREYSSAVYALNAEPFRMKVIADGVFGYRSGHGVKLPVFARATALDRALQASTTSQDRARQPLIASHINCSTSFIFADGVEYLLVGLDYGVYIKESRKDAHWRRCIEVSRVTQIAAFENMNFLVLLSDKALVFYNLDTVISESLKKDSKTKIPGYKLSRSREVGYFTIGRMKDRVLLFYKQREGISSIFKVLEPIKEKGIQQRRSKISITRGVGMSSTEYFREAERFYVPTDSYGLSLFKASFAIHTTKGFEVMSLDLKIGQSIPVMASITGQVLHQALRSTANSLKGYTVESFKKKIEGSKPLGMFRVSDKQLMLCYEDMAMFCDNHGNMIGTTIIELVCRAKKVAVQHPYLIAFDDELVEVRRLDRGGQLKQVISGKDIRAIDTNEGQIKFALAHPEVSNRQLIVELVGNEFVVEDDNSSLADL